MIQDEVRIEQQDQTGREEKGSNNGDESRRDLKEISVAW